MRAKVEYQGNITLKRRRQKRIGFDDTLISIFSTDGNKRISVRSPFFPEYSMLENKNNQLQLYIATEPDR